MTTSPSPPTSTPTQPTAGDGVLHPIALAALALLVVNDHALKARASGPWQHIVTGKLSDVAGLLFFPLLVIAALELLQLVQRRFTRPSRTHAFVVPVVVAALFAAMKTNDAAAELYRFAIAVMQAPWHAVVALVLQRPWPGLVHVQHVVDPTDLIALPSCACAAWLAAARAARRCDVAPQG